MRRHGNAVRGATGAALAGLLLALTGCSSEPDQTYWYCWDSGAPKPHHLGHKVEGDHFCSADELIDAGFEKDSIGHWNP